MKGRILVNNWKEPIKQLTNKQSLYNKQSLSNPPKTFWDKFQSILNIILN